MFRIFSDQSFIVNTPGWSKKSAGAKHSGGGQADGPVVTDRAISLVLQGNRSLAHRSNRSRTCWGAARAGWENRAHPPFPTLIFPCFQLPTIITASSLSPDDGPPPHPLTHPSNSPDRSTMDLPRQGQLLSSSSCSLGALSPSSRSPPALASLFAALFRDERRAAEACKLRAHAYKLRGCRYVAHKSVHPAVRLDSEWGVNEEETREAVELNTFLAFSFSFGAVRPQMDDRPRPLSQHVFDRILDRVQSLHRSAVSEGPSLPSSPAFKRPSSRDVGYGVNRWCS